MATRASLFRMEGSIQCGGAGEDPDYVFDTLVSGTSLVVSLSSMSLQHVDLTSGALLSQFTAHRDRINTIELSRVNPGLVLSASSDRTVALWDLRTSSGTAIASITLPDEVLGASLGAGDALVATACGQSVQFYDLRQFASGRGSGSGKIGEYADAHTDLVTQVTFHPTQPSLLFSAAEDGLICVFDTAVAEEEEAVVSVLNTDCPVRRFGFFGAGGGGGGALEGLYSLSTIETASFWHFGSAQRVGNFPEARQQLGVDYLVDCMYCPLSDELLLLAGNYGGRAVLASVDPSALRLKAMLQSCGHVGTVRCCALLAEAGGGAGAGAGRGGLAKCLTGGEDGRVVTWAAAEPCAGSDELVGAARASASASGGGGAKPHKASASLRSTPY